MAFSLGFNSQRFGAPIPPRAPFGNFRMQFRPGLSGTLNGTVIRPTQEPDVKPTNESGLLFVSNIDETCPNDLVKDMLDVFGKVDKWTRIKGPDGNFPPFGFCGYEESSAAVMAILTLNNFTVGTKRLNVKPDETAKQTLVDFVVKDRIAKRLSRKALGKELEPDEGDKEEIKKVRKRLREILYNRDHKLVHDEDLDEPERKVESPTESDKHSTHRTGKDKKHHPRKRLHSHRRSRSYSRSPGKGSKKRRRSGSSSSSSSSHSSDNGRRSRRRDPSADSKINGLDSDDSDVVLERKERKREQRRKDEQYLKFLKKFEERERRMSKQYMREDEEEQTRRKELQKEAKKLVQFLEDYDDDRDDNKYYKDSVFNKRKRDYEAEREADAKDRQEELKEIESIKAMILSENKNVLNKNRLRNDGTSPQVSANKINGTQPFRYTFAEETPLSSDNAQHSGSTEWTPAYDKPSTSSETSKGGAKLVITFQSKILSPVNSVFAEEEPEEENTHIIKKKLVPFEITAKDRIGSLTAEERKQMVKELIEATPTHKDALFEYQVAWDQLDSDLIEQKIKPWVEKKIRDYIGDEEPSLVSFICERITTHSEPARLLGDLAMILDDEAESFIIKLWRLIIFQTEAKKVGLNVNSSKS